MHCIALAGTCDHTLDSRQIHRKLLWFAVQEGLKYMKSHEWAKVDGDTVTVGISDFAQVGFGTHPPPHRGCLPLLAAGSQQLLVSMLGYGQMLLIGCCSSCIDALSAASSSEHSCAVLTRDPPGPVSLAHGCIYMTAVSLNPVRCARSRRWATSCTWSCRKLDHS